MSGGGSQEEPRWLTESMLLAIHARQIERYGGAHGVLDPAVVRSALAGAIERWGHDEATDLADLTPVYLRGFSRSRGFRDGNERTGLASALVFLRLNGRMLRVQGKELYALTTRVSAGDADDGIVATYLRSRMETT